MFINFFGYYNQNDGYGRFSSRMAEALSNLIYLEPYHIGILDMPDWMLYKQAVNWGELNITCAPPYMVKKMPGRHWLYSMTEGSRIPQRWVDSIAESEVERVLVPCQHNLHAFRDSGVTVPISVVPGGTDPDEFPFRSRVGIRTNPKHSYTFLCFADRGERKGFPEVWEAFYMAFGGKTLGNQNVRLIIKGRMKDRSLLAVLSKAQDADPRVIYQEMDVEDMNEVYRQADCLVLPSRSEGWGMIHREAACTGLPVITQAYSGLEDAKNWAMVVDGAVAPIPSEVATALGEWRIADKEDLAQKMKFCYHSPETAAGFGYKAAQWIRKNQTWEKAALQFMELLENPHDLPVERTAVCTA